MSIHDLLKDMKRLMILAYPDLIGRAADSVGVGVFANALGDKQMRKDVLFSRPQTMEAVTLHQAVH